MPGWIVLFALLAVFGLIMTLPEPTVAPVVTSLVFSALFVTSLAARIIRKRG